MNTRTQSTHSLVAAWFMTGFTGAVLAQQAIPPAGLGTPEQPYLIRQLGELVWAQGAAGSASHYRLENDIDATETGNWVGGFHPLGFSPSGFQTQPFTGSFDGGGFAIRNLAILRSASVNVGLFGYIGTNGFVHDLRVEGAFIQGSTRVGILAGLNQGTVSNCVVTGRVEGRGAVGGIAGENTSFSTGFFTSKTGRLLQTSARAEVNGIQNVGGLAGINSGTIVESFSTGQVQSPTAGYATGGLVGGNLHGVIDRSSSSAVTDGGERVGGLVGFHSGNTNGLIRESFSVGPVTGRPTSTGGMVGHASSKARTESSYWDTGSSGQSFSAAGTGLDSGRLRNPTHLTGWAVGTVWTAGPVGSLLRHAWAPPLVRVEVLSQGPGTARLLTENPNQTQGSKAGIEAAANANAEFIGWRGVGIGQATSPQTEVTFDIDQQVVAVFRSVHEVRTSAELRRIGREPGYTLSDRYRLMADLDFTGETALSPIGPDSTNSFTGVFDGNGHTLRNLQIGSTTNSTSALFGWVGAGGEIRDLHLTDAQVTGQSRVAGIAAMNLGRIAGSTLTGQVAGRDDVGGIAGINHGVIEDCSSEGTIAGLDHVGGIAGSHVGGRITRPSFQGRIEGGPGSHSVGGICGWSHYGIIEGAEVAGTIAGSHFIGGVFGILQGSELTGFHGTNLAISGRFATGGIAGALRDATVTDSTAHGTVTSTDSVGGAFGQAYRSSALRMQTDLQTTGNSDVGGLVGSSLISTWDEIHTTGQVQGEDRVGGWAGTLEGGGLGNARNDAAVSGRHMVGGGVGRLTGVLADTRAEGAVNGASHVGGLVGENWTGSIGRSQAHGSVEGTESVGGLVGLNFGSIDASTASGSVHAELLAGGLVGLNRNGSVSRSTAKGDATAGWVTGGLVGENFFGNLRETMSMGTVTGDFGTGGLVGANTGGVIRGSSATGVVLAGIRGGGLIGENTIGGLIRSSYSSAAVVGVSEIGGLVGYNQGLPSNSRIIRCYSSGSTTGSGRQIGGLVGLEGDQRPGEALVEQSYWQNDAQMPVNSQAGIAVTTGQLIKKETFAGWDFESEWQIIEGRSAPIPAWQDSRPILRVVAIGPGRVTISPQKPDYLPGEVVTLTAEGDAGIGRFFGWTGASGPTASAKISITMNSSRTIMADFGRVHPITTIDDLARIGRDPQFSLRDHYWLKNDIDASTTTNWNDAGTSEAVREGFPPIGSEQNPFLGSFDGQGRVLRHLHIGRPSQDNVGLFATAGRGALIRNVRISRSSITGNQFVGSLVGDNWGGHLEACSTEGETIGVRAVGGVVGSHSATIDGCSFSGKVSLGQASVYGRALGGIAGSAEQAILQNCTFHGTMLGTTPGQLMGGIVGFLDTSLVSGCNANGVLGGFSIIGGIAGHAENSQISFCSNGAQIDSPQTSWAGGVAGTALYCTISHSANLNSIRARSVVGGLLGDVYSSTIQDCYSQAAIGILATSTSVGGLVGRWANTQIDRSYANGSINGQGLLGGIIGMPFGIPTHRATYWNQDIGGGDLALNPAGRSTSELMQRATFEGWDFDLVWAIHPSRNGGFPYLRGLAYPGMGADPDAAHLGGTSLLSWIARNQDLWPPQSLASVPSSDLLVAFILNHIPEAGLADRLQFHLHSPEVGVHGTYFDADLSLDGQPVSGTLQARWIVESATDPEGPWERLDWTDQTPPLVAGRTRFELPAPAGNLFRVRIEPGLLR